MAEDHNVSGKEHNAKQPTASGFPTEGHSPLSDAPKLCTHGPNSRNLIVCIDGTGNQFGEKNTNVIELYNLLLKEDEQNQRTWYNSGIGTYTRPSWWKSLKFLRRFVVHKIDFMIALNFEKTVLAAYQWLSDNYQSGDCIYLFGFSRGAYQVRVLSAMIDKVGLIYKGNETQIPFAYELYSDPESHLHEVTQVGSSQNQDEDKMSRAERFKKVFSFNNVTVHFVGAWETVSSIGFARTSIFPGTIEGMKHVCYFRHALALDERRVKYLPEYAYGGTSMPPDATKKGANTPPVDHQLPRKDDSPPNRNADGPIVKNELSEDIPPIGKDGESHAGMKLVKPPPTIEVWFAGTHSDIGGGNVANAGMGRSRPPLRWMVFEAGALGLRTAPFKRELSPDEQIEIQESLTLTWWPLELLPCKRLTYTRRQQGKLTTHKPHFGAPRKIHPGQKIHSSLLLSDKPKYTPKACPLDEHPDFWEKGRTGLGNWLEIDLYDHTQTLVKNLITEGPGNALQTLRQTAMWADGRQAVYDQVIGALKGLKPKVKYQLLHFAMDILGTTAWGSISLKLNRLTEIFPLLSNLLESNIESYKTVGRHFLVEFTDCCLFALDGHTNAVNSVMFSPDGSRIVSGSDDNTVRVWNAETGKPVGVPFRGHTDWVISVAFSPDGKRLVSGSIDGTVRIWDAETGRQMGEAFGRTFPILSVSFTPDGRHVVSGEFDGAIQIWDAETGNQIGERLGGHTGWVLSVTFSPDGKRVALYSGDGTVRIWDVETGKPVGEPFPTNRNSILGVAFSPDGKRVVSGSDNATAWVWNAETGKPVGEPFQRHTESVISVAFSPDGKRVASGSGDRTVRIWDADADAETREQVGGPFRGHTDRINSVAFSPDGKRVVSGSEDTTIRIWDVEAAELVAKL